MRSSWIALAMTSITACGGSDGNVAGDVLDGLDPATLSPDPALAKYWAQTSAPNTLVVGEAPLVLADITLQANENETCPKKTETDTKITYEGGCTTLEGFQWYGKAVSTSSVSGGTLSYDGFGYDSTSSCTTTEPVEVPTHLIFDGTVTLSGSVTSLSFSIDMKYVGMSVDEASCTPTVADGGIHYNGKMVESGPDADMDGEADEQVWSGSGRVGNAQYGVANVKTEGEVINDVACSDEAMSGNTTISSDGHAIQITYDGATDCNPDSTVRWSFDGADQGELAGVSCNAGSGGGGAVILAALGLVLRRRRRV